MLLTLISDTHAAGAGPWMQEVYERWMAPADLLLHMGDTTGRGLWSFFMQHPGFHAVAGNMDDWALASELPRTLSLAEGGLTIGMAHGFGYSGRPLWRAVAEGFGPDYDLVCFGHTHEPAWELIGSTRVVNPGSLRETGAQPTLAQISVAEDGSMEHRLVQVPKSF